MILKANYLCDSFILIITQIIYINFCVANCCFLHKKFTVKQILYINYIWKYLFSVFASHWVFLSCLLCRKNSIHVRHKLEFYHRRWQLKFSEILPNKCTVRNSTFKHFGNKVLKPVEQISLPNKFELLHVGYIGYRKNILNVLQLFSCLKYSDFVPFHTCS